MVIEQELISINIYIYVLQFITLDLVLYHDLTVSSEMLSIGFSYDQIAKLGKGGRFSLWMSIDRYHTDVFDI